MVVDDEPNIADTLSLILNNHGYKATAVYSAEEAIAAMPAVHPLIVIADVIMGKLSGVDLAEYVTKHLPNCRVFLMSGHKAAAELLDRSAKAGFSFTLVAKPFHPSEILKLIAF
jgi:DNA-binding NtrC family response regulator